MKKYILRPVGLFFLTSLTFMMVMTQTSVKGNSPAPAHVSGYTSHEKNQNSWGLFGIIGVIALAGLTKRNIVPKNE